MRILTYSDLHLEFGADFRLLPEDEGDLLILVGDIITFQNFAPLDRLLQAWKSLSFMSPATTNIARSCR